MTLNLTSVAKVREPGFSRSECLELARQIDNRTIGIGERKICNYKQCHDQRFVDPVSERQLAVIIAALRAFAE